MVLLFIVYNNAVDEEMVEIVKELAGGYTKFIGVQGEGSHEPQLGTHIWPGINNCLMVAVERTGMKKIVDSIDWLCEKFPDVGVRIFSTQLKQIR